LPSREVKTLLYVSPGYADFTTDFSEEKVQVDSLTVLSCCQ